VQSTPAYALAGLFLVFGMFCIFFGSALATPFKTASHSAHFAFDGLRLLYCVTVFPPGVFTFTLLNVLDFFLPSTITLRITRSFKKLLYVSVFGNIVNSALRSLLAQVQNSISLEQMQLNKQTQRAIDF